MDRKNNCWHFNIYEQEKFHAQFTRTWIVYNREVWSWMAFHEIENTKLYTRRERERERELSHLYRLKLIGILDGDICRPRGNKYTCKRWNRRQTCTK